MKETKRSPNGVKYPLNISYTITFSPNDDGTLDIYICGRSLI